MHTFYDISFEMDVDRKKSFYVLQRQYRPYTDNRGQDILIESRDQIPYKTYTAPNQFTGRPQVRKRREKFIVFPDKTALQPEYKTVERVKVFKKYLVDFVGKDKNGNVVDKGRSWLSLEEIKDRFGRRKTAQAKIEYQKRG